MANPLRGEVRFVAGVEYLLTWNCKRIAKPAFRPRIDSVCHRIKFDPTPTCALQEFLESAGEN